LFPHARIVTTKKKYLLPTEWEEYLETLKKEKP
jgi:hypothetical protein